ncbi:MIEAP-like protein [Mya arenaria]|uniref:Mitochondria-eating protein n=1 Tax=Mya arenaria TaxID=6604 RepID=A0ABY7DNX1_MYAAR|nr:MIEAP-like protein [Mya arenaria]
MEQRADQSCSGNLLYVPPNRLADAQDELVRLRARSNLVDDLERQIRQLKNELFIATSKTSYLESDTLDSLTKYRYTPRISSPLSMDDPVQRVRESNLISRWNDLFSQDRLDAMDTLRSYSADHENNQRIIFEAVKESFHVAKTAFRQFKMKVRSNLAITHSGPETLEEAVQDYVNRNVDLYDAPGMVSTFNGRGTVSLYRRSYDSEYTAPLVNHHIWPGLIQGAICRMKGECCTRRGASLVVTRPSYI